MQKQLIMSLDMLAKVLTHLGDTAEPYWNTPITRTDFGKRLLGVFGVLYVSANTSAAKAASAAATADLLSMDHIEGNEPPGDFNELELRMCSAWKESGAFTQVTPEERSTDNIPSSLREGFLGLSGKKFAKVQDDIFQEELYANYHRNIQNLTIIFNKLGIPAHRHFCVYTIFQNVFNSYMSGSSGVSGSHTNYLLTPTAFENMTLEGNPLYLAPTSLQQYLQNLYSSQNPNLPASQRDYYTPLPEVVARDLPEPQQYAIRDAKGTILAHPQRLTRNDAGLTLQSAGFGLSCSRLGNNLYAGVYAKDMTCLHGMSDDLVNYLLFLKSKLLLLANNEVDFKPYISGGTEPGHGGSSYFSLTPETAGYLNGHQQQPTAILNISERDKVAKRHGSGNKVDISSRGIVGYLLSLYFGLWTPGSITTKTETIDGEKYTIQILYHLGHFDICVLPSHLYALTQDEGKE